MRLNTLVVNKISLFFFCVLMSLSVTASSWAAEISDVEKWIKEADEQARLKVFDKAEALYNQILEKDPKNYRVMHSLAQVQKNMGKIKEANALVDKILAIPVSNGRDVLVFYPDKATGEEAELVDEIVLPPQRTKNNMRNYIDIKSNKPIPHYRLFFKNTKQMQLVPQSLVRIEYQGVLNRVYADVKVLKAEVHKALIAEAAEGEAGKPPEKIALKGGCFKMGSEKGTPFEQPVHEVCVDPFKIDKTEVNQAQFQKVIGHNQAQITGANLPAESSTWYEADMYCKKVGGRLPTEAEWEYAARGGTTSTFYWGETVNGSEANFCDKNCALNIRVAAVDDGYATTAPVGTFPPNPFGLHDMAGNVAEWVNDWMAPNYYMQSPKDNPQGPRPRNYKLARGGAWNTIAGYMRPSNRAFYDPGMRFESVGFRCVYK